ncbi:hypothetical protein E2C05_26570 [Paracraurococcus ruber]|uniref:Gas vesicle protein n=2 Tax=Paracraurococcus ruber TaxID=77675 RepID=A0ABS1D7N3_9PROT|nr:gas vesicle protein GvpO [Paracraurococcus ruber]MBK1661879.1 hypothetical protein [Paracraurococcus ruber]TDG22999.1 hypothetical protein E2C05_26570 [Paracraurococcus ruber]
MDVTEIVERTKRQMASITGLSPETVARFDRDDEGWSVAIDMIEHRAIPRTNDLLASFEVKLDPGGNVLRWKRLGRFLRSHGAPTQES